MVQIVKIRSARILANQLTLFATVPLIEAIIAMLPPLPHRIISLATAWAVMKTPVTFTSNMVFASFWLYSNAGVSCWIPAAAIRPSRRLCVSEMSRMTLLRFSLSRTSIWR